MNVLDLVILLLFLPGIIRGVSKGFIEQAVSLAGIVASVWMAFKFSSLVSEKLSAYINVSDTVLKIVSFIIILIVVSIVVLLIAKLLTGLFKMANLGWVNRLLGFIFAVALSAVVIGLVAILFDTVNEKFELVTSPVLTESVLYGALRDLGYTVFPFLKELFQTAQDTVTSIAS